MIWKLLSWEKLSVDIKGNMSKWENKPLWEKGLYWIILLFHVVAFVIIVWASINWFE